MGKILTTKGHMRARPGPSVRQLEKAARDAEEMSLQFAREAQRHRFLAQRMKRNKLAKKSR